MSGSATNLATRLLCPDVVDAWYAYDQGAYWLIQVDRNGRPSSQRLPRPPAGATCRRSTDGFATWSTFTVPAPPATRRHLVAALITLAWVVGSLTLLSGSVPAVRLMIAAAGVVLLAVHGFTRRLTDRNPVAGQRLAALIAAYLIGRHLGHHGARH